MLPTVLTFPGPYASEYCESHIGIADAPRGTGVCHTLSQVLTSPGGTLPALTPKDEKREDGVRKGKRSPPQGSQTPRTPEGRAGAKPPS